MELHRNTKTWLLIIGICVVAIIFFRFLAIGIIVVGAIILGFIWTVYRSIRGIFEKGEFKYGSKKAQARANKMSARYGFGRHPIRKAWGLGRRH